MKSKHVTFYENDYLRNNQVINETNALLHFLYLFLLIISIVPFVREHVAVSSYRAIIFTFGAFTIFFALTDIFIIVYEAFYFLPNFIKTDVVTHKDRFGFIFSFNNLAYFIIVFYVSACLGFLWSLYTLDGAFMKIPETLYGVKVLVAPAELAEIYRIFVNVFSTLYVVLCLLVASALGIFINTVHKKGREIFSMDYVKKGKGNKDTEASEHIVFVNNDGNRISIDLNEEQLAFSNGHLIITKGETSVVYRKEDLEKIIVKGDDADREFIYNKVVDRWLCAELPLDSAV